MTGRVPALEQRAFRALLRVYPTWFREAHGAEMEQLFLARRGRVSGPGAAARLWLRIARDALTTALAVRRSRVRRDPTIRPAGGLDMFWQDVRHALRHLVRTPIFTTGAILLLAVGIGANVAVFTAVDRLLLRSQLHVRPDEVVYVYQDSDDGEPSSCSFPASRDMAARTDVFSAVTAISASSATWENAAEPTDVVIEYTTSSYLDVVGLPPLRGRWLGPAHDVAGAEPVAVVSAPTWRSRFGADPDIVGRVVRLNGTAVTIVGVGPDGLAGSYAPLVTDFWLSISATVVGGSFRVANLERREDHWYDVRARLAEGVTQVQAQAAMDALAARLADEFPNLNRGRDITVRPATDVRLYGESRGILALLSALVVTLLLLASANLANLLLVRGLARSGEVAVRRALGAGSMRIGRLYLIESLLLSAAGGVVGVLLAASALEALHRAPLPFPFSTTMDLAIDGRVAGFAIGLMTVTGIFFGLAPALRSIRSNTAAILRDDARTTSIGRATVRLRDALVVVQVGGSLVLILTAGLIVRSLVAMERADTGVDAERVAYVRTNLSRAGLAGPELGVALEELRQRVEALPGVTHAAAASRLPAQSSGTTTTIVEGYTPPAGTDAVELNFTVVTPEYFATVGLPLVEGRGFVPTDVTGAERVVLVNEAAAERFWGGVDPIGRRLRSQSQPDLVRTVVGVVGDAPVSGFPETPVRPLFYVPIGQSLLGNPYVLARTDGLPDALLPSLRAAVTDVRSSLQVAEQGTLAEHFSEALASRWFLARIIGAVSLVALVLAALGIYAVVAFNVARRRTELGLRMALGAEPSRVVGMVVRDAFGAVALGLAGGLVVSALAARQLAPVLFGIGPTDPITFGGAVVFLALVACVAAYLPARRAAMADPSQTLRAS